MTIADSSFMMESGAICLSCSPEEEKRIIKELIDKSEANLRQGNLYYVVSNRWFASWQRYVGLSNDELSSSSEDESLPGSFNRPGPIDNSDIICDAISTQTNDLDLKVGLEEGRDYVLVPQEAWEKLFNWYKGGPELPRKLISQGLLGKTFAVEVYPLRLNLIDSRTGNQFVLRFSKQASICELYWSVCARLGLLQEQIRIWDFFNKHKNSLLEVSDKSLQEANLEMDQDILLEVSEYGSFSSEPGEVSSDNDLALGTDGPSRSSLTTSSIPSVSSRQTEGTGSSKLGLNPRSSRFNDIEDGHVKVTAKKKEEGSGLAGLQNLGNTCFMNSALQCLVHTPPIVEYFLQDYTDDINTKNPLGMHGELALAFGDLLRKLWSSGRNAVAPRVFKGKLGRFAPQFSGYNQHDSQELLAFLLDGLHEDLNRVKQKPYLESKDYDGRPDKDVAEECWKNHKARNDSIIVDICQGQYKSTLVCPDCGKISITFDPFMYLSLPLPSTVTRMMTATVFYGDGSGLPMPYTVTVAKAGCMRDLVLALTSACCLSGDERLLLAKVSGHKIYQYLENLISPLSNIKNEDCIVAYRVPKLSGLTRIEIIHQHHGKYVSDIHKSGEWKLLGSPLVTYIEEDCLSGAGIDRSVTRVLSPLKKSTFMTKSQCNKENALLPAEINSGNDSLGSQSINQSIVDQKDDEMSNSDLTFHLCLVDSIGKISSPLKADTLIRPGQTIKVLLDWTDKEHEIYDATYLEHIPEVKAAVVVKKTKQEAISLSSCLEAFLKEEPLGPDDMWYCPRCKEHRQATKKLDLWRLPDILVFHLKRFSYNRYMKNKLDAFVNFPIHNLDLDKCIGNVSNQHTNVYELYAISNHYGGLGGGHYTAMVKLIEENKWYHFDDSHVSPINEADIKTSAAYVLFYRRVKV